LIRTADGTTNLRVQFPQGTTGEYAHDKIILHFNPKKNEKL